MEKFKNIILSLDFFPKIGGAHLWLYEIGKNWPYDTCVLTSHIPNKLEEQIFFDKGDHGSIKSIFRVPFKITSWGMDINYFRNFLKIFNFFRKQFRSGPIFVHITKVVPEGILILPLKLMWGRKLKLITYAHGEEFLVANTSFQLKMLTKAVLKNSDMIIANSYSTKNIVSSFYDKSKIKVVHPGVEFSCYQIEEKERLLWRKRWGFPQDTIILITIARMEPRKNQDAVIKVLAEFRKEGLPLGYVVGGVGEEEGKLRDLVNELELQQWVKFLGRVSEEEKIKSFCAADIHIMPSIQVGSMIEGFGIVFMEAAAAGIPSIAGNVGGQSEAVLDGKTGIVVDGTNLEEIKDGIKRLSLNVEKRKSLGIQAKQWAREHDWHKVTMRVYNYFRELL